MEQDKKMVKEKFSKKTEENIKETTDESSINHINRLISDSGNDEYFIEENDTVIKPIDEPTKEKIIDDEIDNDSLAKQKESAALARSDKESRGSEAEDKSRRPHSSKEKSPKYTAANSYEKNKNKPVEKDSNSRSKQVTESVKKESFQKSSDKYKHTTNSNNMERKNILKTKAVHNYNDKLKNSSPKKAIILNVKKSEKVEMAQKKNKQKVTHNHPKKHRKVWLWIVFIIIVIAAVIAGLVIVNKQGAVLKKDVAATVNGEPITASDIDTQYNAISPLMRQIYTKEFILNQSINELLLLQESKKRNIIVDDDMINSELEAFKEQNGLDDADLELILVKQNMTLSELKEIVKKKLAVRQLLNQSVLKEISISDAQANDYYVENIDKFQNPEKVKVSHILVMISPNMTEDAAKQKILDINKSLTKDNFCQLVTQYSDDSGSKTNCGTYTFAQGEMVIEFEKASFSLSIGKTVIVQSMYGYHLIKKLDHYPAQVLNFSEVKEDIVQTLSDLQAQEKFDAFMTQLKEKAVIIINQDTLKNDEKTGPSLLEPITTEIIQNTEAKDEVAKTTVQPNEDSSSSSKTEAKPSSEQTATGSSPDSFAKCLTEKGAKLYAASWCPHCRNQKAMFGDSIKYITYVECAVEGNPQIQTDECSKAGITGYPTWIINEKSYPGEQELKDLARITGCSMS